MSFLGKIVGKLKRGSEDAPAPEEPVPELDGVDWIARIRESSKVFENVSDDSVAEMCSRLDVLRVKRGDIIVEQGDEGDYYYLIASGTAHVTRTEAGREAVDLADLDAGKAFGEEALISNAKRNATVKMTEDGVLLRLAKDDFDGLLKEPKLTWLSQTQAQAKVSQGEAKWLDVRTKEEYTRRNLRGAISMPMRSLRARVGSLDKDTLYVCYCQTGRISAAAAFVLAQEGYKVAVLRGGVKRLPA